MRAAALLLGTLLLGGTTLAASPSELFASGQRAFSAEDYAAALVDFLAARDAGMTGPAVDYNVAVCRYRLGDYAAAEEAFVTLADRYADMRDIALYNVGLARVRLGRVAAAREAFARAADGRDSTIARLADVMLSRLEPPSAAPRNASEWLKLIDVSLGQDDNVALSEESSLPATVSTDSPFAELYALISGPYAVTSSWRLDASAYLVSYPDAKSFDQTILRFGGQYPWRKQDWALATGPYLSRSTLDGGGFESRIGASFQARRLLGEGSSLTAVFGHERIDELEARYEFIAGQREYLGLGFAYANGRDRWRLDYRHERNDRLAAGVAPTVDRLGVSFRRRFSPAWSGETQLMYRHSRYDDLLPPRNENLVQLSLRASRELASSWQIVARYDCSDNDSNEAPFAYRRNRVSVSVGKVF